MWKDFFYYTKRERRAVYVLLVLIALCLVGLLTVPRPSLPLADEVVRQDSIQPAEVVSVPREPVVSLFSFDPNTADSIELSSLGLPSYVVRNVLKYRQKGGRFRTPESFARIYGLTEQKFEELKPYIRIVQVDKPKPVKKDTVVPVVKVEKKVFKYPEGTLVDVNTADTAELKKIPGIGSGISKTIVAYRNRLGGFYSLAQLEEVDYVTPELMKWFKLEISDVRPLNINRLSLDRLRAHPYLNFYQAKVIVEHRRKKGEIKSLSQLALYEEFTEKDLKRLSAYIRFD